MYGAEPDLLSLLVVIGVGAFYIRECYRQRAAPSEQEQLAHTDKEQLVDAVVDATTGLFEDGEVSPSVEATFATDLLEYGIVDVDLTEKKLAREAEETVKHQLRESNGQVEVETLHDKLDRVPERIWRRRVQSQLRRGELRRRNGHYLRA